VRNRVKPPQPPLPILLETLYSIPVPIVLTDGV
jgi:hypothetical protein